MPKSQIDGVTLLAAVVAAGVGFFLLSSPFFWMAGIAGLVGAIVLLALDRDGYRSVFESIAYAAATALALALAAAVPLAWLHPRAADVPLAAPISSDWLPLVWAGFTLLITVVDRARMGGRVQYAPAGAMQPISTQPVVSLRTPAPVTPVYTPASEPVRAAPDAATPVAPAVTPRPTFTRPSFSEAEPPAVPHRSEPVVERTPAPVAPPPPPTPPAAAAPAPPPQAIAIPPGKEAMIYVTLMGEGLNVLRAVRAEHLGRDFYKIADEMPETETWQFVPGQVVKCQKKNLSSGKALVAVEEAPRAR